jgi:hypothetical protein
MKTEQQYILDRSIPEPNSGCWLWLLSTGSHGYGQGYGRRGTRDKCVTLAHLISYQAFNGEIVSGMEIDHTCKNKICVNPAHLEMVSQQINIRRQWGYHEDLSQCPHGHPASSYIMNKSGYKECGECVAARHKKKIIALP